MSVTTIAPAYGFTVSRTARVEQQFVYVGPSDEQTGVSYPSNVAHPSPIVDAIFEVANQEDRARAGAAMPFYRTTLQAEGLTEPE